MPRGTQPSSRHSSLFCRRLQAHADEHHQGPTTQQHARKSAHHLRTNKHALPPFAVPLHKLAQSLDARDVSASPEPSSGSPPHALPRVPLTARSTEPGGGGGGAESPGRRRPTWSPAKRVPMPQTLSFESWWTERGQPVRALVSFDTESKVCTAR